MPSWMRPATRILLGLPGQLLNRPHAVPGHPLYLWLVRIGVAAGLALLNVWLVLETISLFHRFAAAARGAQGVAMAHGRWVFSTEQYLHIGVEPALQQWVLAGVVTPMGPLSGSFLQQWVVWIYSNGVPTWLLASLFWAYLFVPRWFAMLRDITIVSLILAVLGYWLFPVAPPRFVLAGAPYHLQDWTHGGASLSSEMVGTLGFNPLAAFPSVHVLWALIPAVSLVWACRHPWMWLLAALFPLTMVFVVMASANHYVFDCLGALGVCGIGLLCALAIDRGRRYFARAWKRQPRIHYTGANLPAAVWFCLACAAVLTTVGTSFSLLAVLVIMVLIVLTTHYNLQPTAQTATRRSHRIDGCHYVAGLCFVAGAPVVTHLPGTDGLVCTVLWLLACLGVLIAHADDRRRLLPHTAAIVHNVDRRSLV